LELKVIQDQLDFKELKELLVLRDHKVRQDSKVTMGLRELLGHKVIQDRQDFKALREDKVAKVV
jgi:hypothetical protein